MKWFIGVAVAALLILGLASRAWGGPTGSLSGPHLTEIQLGVPVAEWFPVDINHDGIWELAIRTSEVPTRVGVYSPLNRAWLDGPLPLPVSSHMWAVFRRGNGNLEYFYLLSRTIHRFNVSTAIDSSLWGVSGSVFMVFGWGMDANDSPLLGVGRQVSSSSCQTPPPGTMTFCNGSVRYPTEIVSAGTGEKVGSFMGDFEPGTNSLACASGGSLYYVALDLESSWFHTNTSPGQSSSRQSLVGVDALGLVVFSASLPSPNPTMIGDPAPNWVPLALADARVDQGATCLITWMSVPPPSYWRSQYEHLTFGAVDFTRGVTQWSLIEPNPDKYTDLCPYDLNRDGTDELILVLPSLPGWEIRTPATGAVEDTILGAPVADLTSLPLRQTSTPDLFLVVDSSLLLYEPDTPTGILDDPNDGVADDASEGHLSFSAFPNPFNAAVTLSWSTTAEARSLTIYNILGQSVRTYALSTDSRELTWDGRDAQGRGVASGVYFARLETRTEARSVKLIMLR